ncbi:MAG TPA: hypothetical protein VHC44_13485 [Verrucomicrobiae bacterium]|nr:hypothetical protein [Verrucomicrobiae bacterium]
MLKAGTKRASSEAHKHSNKNHNGETFVAVKGKISTILFPKDDYDFVKRVAEKETGGDIHEAINKIVREGEKAKLPKLKTVVEYELPGTVSMADTLYWGGRWPDDFFLGRRLSGQPPKPTNIADVFDWLACISEIARFGFVNEVNEGELGLERLYHAAALELRMDSTPEEKNTEEQYMEARQRNRAKN